MRRRLVVAAMLLTAGCEGTLIGPEPPADRRALFEQVWSEVDRHYALFLVKGVNWDSLHAVYAPRAAAAASDFQLAQTIGAMLAELRDVHVTLNDGFLSFGYYGWNARPAHFNSFYVFSTYVPNPTGRPGNPLVYGRIAPAVGYVWIESFGGSGFGAAVDQALEDLRGVDAFILDVRHNQGGQTRNALEVAGRFTDRARTYAFVRYRDGPRHGDFTPRRPITVAPAGARRFDGPVVVLTNRRTFSAAEEFVLAMKVRPGVVVVGDSTGGAVGNPLIRELPNSWTFRISQWIEETPDGVVFEEVGLAPDVWVRGSSAEVYLGRDAPLDSALAVAMRGLPRAGPAPGGVRTARRGPR